MKQSVERYVAVTVLAFCAATAAAAFLAPRPTAQHWETAAFFGLLGLFASLLSYRRSVHETSGAISFLPFLSGVLVAPTAAMAATAAAAQLAADILSKRTPLKAVFNAAQIGVATAVAAIVLAPRGGIPVEFGLDSEHALWFVAAAAAFFSINASLVVGAISLSERRAYAPLWRRVVTSTFVFDLLALPVVALLAWTYVRLGSAWLVVILLPLLGIRQLYKQNAQLEKVTEELLQLMVAAIEARDPYTSGHSRRVSAYSRIIARTIRLPSKQVDRLGAAALLHDVGKIHEVYAPILRKPDRLTPEEVTMIQTHPVKSEELVGKVSQLRDLLPAVRGHHERWDGCGYPDRLAADQIPLGARVIAIADTIDAMLTSRPYRGALDLERVRAELVTGRGAQFDPALVDAVLATDAWERLAAAVRRFDALPASTELTADEFVPAPRAGVPLRVAS